MAGVVGEGVVAPQARCVDESGILSAQCRVEECIKRLFLELHRSATVRYRPLGGRADTPNSCAALAIASIVHGADAARSRPAARAPGKSDDGVVSQASVGTSMPASRSASPSLIWATPSQVAPEATAVRATGTRP